MTAKLKKQLWLDFVVRSKDSFRQFPALLMMSILISCFMRHDLPLIQQWAIVFSDLFIYFFFVYYLSTRTIYIRLALSFHCSRRVFWLSDTLITVFFAFLTALFSIAVGMLSDILPTSDLSMFLSLWLFLTCVCGLCQLLATVCFYRNKIWNIIFCGICGFIGGFYVSYQLGTEGSQIELTSVFSELYQKIPLMWLYSLLMLAVCLLGSYHAMKKIQQI